jgi:hypothetical protein
MAATQLRTTAIRSYRVYLRDAESVLAKPYDVDLSSDEDALSLAVLMLDRQAIYPCVEVWDRARLVCVVRKGE